MDENEKKKVTLSTSREEVPEEDITGEVKKGKNKGILTDVQKDEKPMELDGSLAAAIAALWEFLFKTNKHGVSGTYQDMQGNTVAYGNSGNVLKLINKYNKTHKPPKPMTPEDLAKYKHADEAIKVIENKDEQDLEKGLEYVASADEETLHRMTNEFESTQLQLEVNSDLTARGEALNNTLMSKSGQQEQAVIGEKGLMEKQHSETVTAKTSVNPDEIDSVGPETPKPESDLQKKSDRNTL